MNLFHLMYYMIITAVIFSQTAFVPNNSISLSTVDLGCNHCVACWTTAPYLHLSIHLAPDTWVAPQQLTAVVTA